MRVHEFAGIGLSLAACSSALKVSPGLGPQLLEQSCVLPEGARVVRMLNGTFDMVVHADGLMSDGIVSEHWWEIKEPQDLAADTNRTIPAGGTFLDIGANMGYYSMLFAAWGYNVIAVEPMGLNRIVFEASLCLNPALRPRIKIIPVALGAPEDVAKRCVVRSSIYDEHAGYVVQNKGNGIVLCGDDKAVKSCSPEEKECYQPEVKTLDMLLAEEKPVAIDVVKIDVEDFECNVMQGGQSLFRDFAPKFVQVETASVKSHICAHDQALLHGYATADHMHWALRDTVMARSSNTKLVPVFDGNSSSVLSLARRWKLEAKS